MTKIFFNALFRGQKVTRSINAVTDNAPYAGRGVTILLKLARFFYSHLSIAF